MKKHILDFLHRGLLSCSFGPLVLAVIYLILHAQAGIETLSVTEVCCGIFSLAALSFLAGGMNVVYQIERLPLLLAILIHGLALYFGYLVVYLTNGWLNRGAEPLLLFTVIFVVGYAVIWVMIMLITKLRTAKLNAALSRKRQRRDG